jgi:UDP-N-acetylmuramoyl-tripeptide--D-alanyl-D-alanine ligase
MRYRPVKKGPAPTESSGSNIGIVRTILKGWRHTIREYRAVWRRRTSRSAFIGVTGSSAKSTTASLLAHILEGKGQVIKQIEFNTRRSVMGTLRHAPRRTDFVVIEVGVGHPGQMKPMAKTLRPDLAIVTLIGHEHHSAFRSREAIAAEKGELVAAVRRGGLALLFADDPLVIGMASRTAERVVTFGRSPDSDFRAINVHAAFPQRLRLEVVWRGGTLGLDTKFAGEHFFVPTLAATAAALELGLPSEVVAERVASFEPLLTRCGVVTVRGGPQFIVDTVKAPWHSIGLAFEMIASASAPRKRIVLGQMSDFAGSNRRYRDAYRLARSCADEVIFVGDHAHRSGATQEDRQNGRFIDFRTPLEAAGHIRRTAIADEVILLKGSPNLHLERIALAWTTDVKCWEPACGKKFGCLICGRYQIPYELHRSRRRLPEGGPFSHLEARD